jgi:hypothetical protein
MGVGVVGLCCVRCWVVDFSVHSYSYLQVCLVVFVLAFFV